ncbi:MAG: S9 family peptidase, partial [Gammaproteobacteria bacterium]|nr:S9 family peptidase [Gammaproteobacteria bacterium]
MKKAALVLIGTALLWAGFVCAQPAEKLVYPVAHRDNTVDVYFGTKVPAPYQWMENLESPALHKWVDAENAVTDAYL